jgi:hypothetical protein
MFSVNRWTSPEITIIFVNTKSLPYVLHIYMDYGMCLPLILAIFKWFTYTHVDKFIF